MSRFDHLDLDGHLLALLLAVYEEGSVTRAAQRLGVTQSAVSHLLEKLRAIAGDPLFVRSGRGIQPTARAEVPAARARVLLEDFRSFTTAGGFDAARLDATVTIAANDLQRDLLLPALLRRLRAQAPNLKLRVIHSGVPTAEMLRDGQCQLVISPRPPDAADVVQKRLFEDSYAVFYDPRERAAPASLQEYLAAEHVTVVYEPRRALDFDRWLDAQPLAPRRIAASVPSFAAVSAFVQGGPLLATLPSLLRVHQLRDLACAPLPLDCPAMPMYLVWHVRHQAEPVHVWLRREVEALVPRVLQAATPDAAGPAFRAARAPASAPDTDSPPPPATTAARAAA
ncbi:LysR family transcriptional regulator [Azohydromonas aeria]|uniref:LysR family transcriptional regulator n=1 Tax=Azohydromonas aeria TaxID=2590212 RepID=UPI0012FC2BCA|nr:LysR family transcriptional regulator [Azohydromonas aeria]